MVQSRQDSRPVGAECTLEIEIENESEHIPFDLEKARRTVRMVLEGEKIVCGRLEVTIIGDPAIHRLNVQFLGHDYPTDVLAFELDRDVDSGFLEGNVIVSDDTALDRAREFGWAPENELLLYIIHGTLHLAGYDDHAKEDERAMRAKEREYMAKAGIETIAAPGELGKKEA